MIKAASLFSNVGIDEFYFKEEGVEVVLSNELLAERCKFYNFIYPKVDMVQGDICEGDVFALLVKKYKELS